MDLDTFIKIFTMVGSFAGFGALYLSYKQFKRLQPIIDCYVEQGEYEIKKSGEKKNVVNLKCVFVINNRGGAPTSINSCRGFLRLHPSVAKLNNPILETSATNNSFPYEVKADQSTKIELNFSFEMDSSYYHYLDRCGILIDLFNPKKIEWEDQPLLTKFALIHSKGYFEVESCIYRKDLPESKHKYDGIDFRTYFDIKDRFNPIQIK